MRTLGLPPAQRILRGSRLCGGALRLAAAGARQLQHVCGACEVKGGGVGQEWDPPAARVANTAARPGACCAVAAGARFAALLKVRSTPGGMACGWCGAGRGCCMRTRRNCRRTHRTRLARAARRVQAAWDQQTGAPVWHGGFASAAPCCCFCRQQPSPYM